MKRILTFIIALAFTLGVSAQNYDVIDPELQKVLNQKSNDKISINIVLDTQADNEQLLVKYEGINDKSLQRENVIKELKAFATDNQNKLMALLQDEAGKDKVVDIKAHWIVNTINCTATRDVIYKLSEQPGISVIGLNDKVKLLSDERPTRVSQSKSIIDNVTTVGADNVWAAGYTGKGVTVAVLDSGVNSEHVDLADHLWDGGNEYPDHGWNFIDNNSNTNDNHGHGTHCAGTICGDGTSGTQTGMAPDATLMCVKVLDDEGSGTLEALVSGIEFAVEHGADIMSISLGWTFPTSYVSIIMREMFENVLAAGVVAAVAAGNERDGIDTIPIPRNITAPGNCPPPWLHPDQQYNPGGLSAVVSVGAVDYSDNVAYFSSRGPVTWQGTEWDDYKYDFRYNDKINLEEGWLYYDNGIRTEGIGGPDYFQWGIMIPAATLQQYEGSYMTKVAIYDLVADNPQLLIYYGGDYAPETLVYAQDCELSGSNSMVEIELDEALPVYDENIWVVMYTQNGTSYPAACCDNTGDPNGRWLSIDGTTWDDLINYGLYNTWMLRAYVTDYNTMDVAELNTITDYEFPTSSKGTLSVSGLGTSRMTAASNEDYFGLIRPDVCAPGVSIVSSAYDDNYGFYYMSGTSMATPCVAGVMALMLDKDPSLTPADICRILETTATKLESTKSNFSGSGRINADMAINEIENTEGNNPITQKYRNVLIEEFTGRDCVWCPMGHAAINDVMAENPGKVFAVNYHAANSLSPTSYPNLNTSYGNVFFNAWNITGIPSALVNRNNAIVHPATEEFNNNVNSQLSQLTEVKIEGNVNINPVTRHAEITVELDYLSNSNYSTNYLTIMMLQDSIFGSQSGADQSNPEQIVDGQYCHMHVLRDVITNTWGDAITPTTAGSHLTKTYIYEIPEVIGDPNGVEVDLDNIYFLAFVTEKQDGTPTRPVLNVNKLENLIGTDEPIHPYIKTFAQEDVISCDKTKKFTANVVNGGTEVITSLKFEVKVAGGATTTEEWEGYLPAYENTNIDLFAEVPWGGAEVSAKIVEANGETFTFETSVMAFSEEWIQIELDDTQATEEFKLELAQDRFGNQITWKVIGHNDNILASGGPYKMLSSSGTEVHIEYFTIPAGECAKFIIEDNVGNGINGSFGNGYYKLYDSKGNVLINSDGNFGFGEEHVIYVNGNGEEQTPTVEIEILNVTPTSVEVSFNPTGACASYYILLDTEESMNMWATEFGVTLEQLIEMWSIERTGASTNLWNELVPNTEYTIFVLSKDIEGNVIQLDRKNVTTEVLGDEGVSVIDLQVEILTNTTIFVTATPNEATAEYHYIIVEKAYAESIGIDEITQLIHSDAFALYGIDEWEWTGLKENTEYYAVAQGMNAKGEWGSITKVEFVTTIGETPKDPVITPQSPLIFFYEGNEITNTVNEITIESDINESLEIQFDLVVGNSTANDMNVVCEIEDISNVGSSYICWGSCYTPGTTGAVNTVYAGSSAEFNGHAMFYDEDWNELPKGTVIPVRYTFYDESNPSEQYVFNVKFIYENDDTANYWTPDESLYANNMTVITTVEIEGEEQYNPNLELGAFCNGELRGSARLQYVDSPANRYECFLMVYGNSNDNITFQLYDHGTGKVSELTSYESIAFEVNATIGDVTNPYTVNFIGSVIHSRDLTSGWNWYSTYILNEGAEGLASLEAAVGTNGIQIKNQTKFVNQASGNWYGTLTSTAVEDMFMIQMSAAHTLNLEGYVVNPADHPITLGTNWKWISYPLAAEMSVEEAFASANPSNGDYVKSQKGFAQYYEGLGWSGTLQVMTPGMGYMYQNTSGYAKTLVYPMANAKSKAEAEVEEDLHWTADATKYPMNMTVIAVVEDAARDYEVAAFSNGECRGSARPIYIEALGQSMVFMTIYGDDNDNVSFRYYDVTTGEEVALNDEMTFEVNATHGDVMEPYVMTLSTMGIDEASAGFNIYPNPVQDKLYIETEAEIEEVVVYDVYGRVQNLRNSETQKLRNSIDVSNLNSGVYFVQIKTEEGNITKRFVKE